MMRLELGSHVACTDGTLGKLVDVVIDPTARRVTHLVVESRRDERDLLVPAALAEQRAADGEIALRTSLEEAQRLQSIHEVAYLRLDGFPVDDPAWDVGVEDVFALPYYPSYDLEPQPLDYTISYDRVPRGEVEIRRTSDVYSADGQHLGTVDGFLVDRKGGITHVVLAHGHLLGRGELTIPLGAVESVETDTVTLNMTREEVGTLSPAPVRRWPQAVDRARAARR